LENGYSTIGKIIMDLLQNTCRREIPTVMVKYQQR